jgi:hypothetical protein
MLNKIPNASLFNIVVASGLKIQKKMKNWGVS